jgi:hypothetical protein
LLVLLAVATACADRDVVAPSPGYSISKSPARLPAPSDVRATLVGGGKGIVISWSYSITSYTSGPAGFLVERQADETGPWNLIGFTQQSSMGDAASAGSTPCYRVTAVNGANKDLSSAPSSAACVGKNRY